MDSKPILYIKSGCPWCNDALSFFACHGIELDVRDVRTSPDDMQRMVRLTNQSKTPTFEYGPFVVADFSVNEFQAALERAPGVKRELGLLATPADIP